MFAWIPPDSDQMMGAILLRTKPEKELTPRQYFWALVDRIDRLVAKEDPEVAEAMLEDALFQEGLSVRGNLRSTGELMVENSDILTAKSAPPTSSIPVREMKHSPLLQRQIQDETLEEFLATLYR